MQVVASLTGMEKRLWARLVEQGIKADWVGEEGNEQILVTLPPFRDPQYFTIPQPIVPFAKTLLINCTEHGGNGIGTVVCGTDGSRLRHFKRETRIPPEKEIAYFRVPNEVATVSANGGEETKISVRIHRVVFLQNNLVQLASSKIWVGRRIEHLSGKFIFFRHAVEAAIAKKMCEPCNHAHFVLDQESLLASGVQRV